MTAASDPSFLAPGTLIGGRFVVDALTTQLGTLAVLSGRDRKSNRAISLWTISVDALSADAIAATRAAVKTAAGTVHRHLLPTFGATVDPAGLMVVATDLVGDESLASALAAARESQAPCSLEQAFALLSGPMEALAVVHATFAHGALAPALLRVARDGRVLVAGLGMLAPLTAAHAVDHAYTAPEVLAGHAPGAAADVYSLGAVLFELCTLRRHDGGVTATGVNPALPFAFDVVLESCLAHSPADRFANVTELRNAIASLVAPVSQPTHPVEPSFEVTIETSVRPPPPSATDEADALRPSTLDVAAALGDTMANETARWMFVRDGIEHGPLPARELAQSILRHEVGAADPVTDMDTADRRPLAQWPQFTEFLDEAVDRRKHEQRTADTKHAIVQDRTSSRAKGAVAVAALAAVAMVGGVYWVTLGPGRSAERRQAELDEAMAHGRLHVSEGQMHVLATPPPVRRRPSPGANAGTATGSSGGSFTGSYEAAMNEPVEMDMNGSGGTLQDDQIAAPLNRALGRFASCAAGGGSAQNVQMRIAVAGNGAPMGVTVLSGSSGFKSCVTSVVRGLRWNAFGGPRVGFTWGFSLQ